MIVKICGITNLADALDAIAGGAHALGFNFYPRSPRYIRPVDARAIAAELPGEVLRVGVFVHEAPAGIEQIMETAQLHIAQIHHGELPVGLRSWRARNVDDTFDALELEEQGPEAFLLDAPAPGTYGGTGKVFDWTRVPSVQRKIVLAGGLDASNVGAAIRTARPWGVDACSRLESAPGRKDRQKVRDFIQTALEETL